MDPPLAVGDFVVVATGKTQTLHVVSAITGQPVSLIDFGDEDGAIEILEYRVIKVAR